MIEWIELMLPPINLWTINKRIRYEQNGNTQQS